MPCPGAWSMGSRVSHARGPGPRAGRMLRNRHLGACPDWRSGSRVLFRFADHSAVVVSSGLSSLFPRPAGPNGNPEDRLAAGTRRSVSGRVVSLHGLDGSVHHSDQSRLYPRRLLHQTRGGAGLPGQSPIPNASSCHWVWVSQASPLGPVRLHGLCRIRIPERVCEFRLLRVRPHSDGVLSFPRRVYHLRVPAEILFATRFSGLSEMTRPA